MATLPGYTLEKIVELTFVQFDMLITEAAEIMEAKAKALQL